MDPKNLKQKKLGGNDNQVKGLGGKRILLGGEESKAVKFLILAIGEERGGNII